MLSSSWIGLTNRRNRLFPRSRLLRGRSRSLIRAVHLNVRLTRRDLFSYRPLIHTLRCPHDSFRDGRSDARFERPLLGNGRCESDSGFAASPSNAFWSKRGGIDYRRRGFSATGDTSGGKPQFRLGRRGGPSRHTESSLYIRSRRRSGWRSSFRLLAGNMNLPKLTPNQSSEPTLASGTSPAGQEPRLP